MNDLRTPPPEGPNEPGKRPRGNQTGPVRPKRTKERGPLGFGSVMRDVKGGRPGAGGTRRDAASGSLVDGAARHGAAPGGGIPGGHPGAAAAGMPGGRPVGAGEQAAAEMGAVQSAMDLDADHVQGIRGSSEQLAAEDTSATIQQARQDADPARLGRLTPNAMLDAVVDEATKLAIEEASKELHVELEPEDLGPLIVTLKRDGKGLSVHLRARQADAARLLDSGLGLLESRLRTTEHGAVDVRASHDPLLVLG